MKIKESTVVIFIFKACWNFALLNPYSVLLRSVIWLIKPGHMNTLNSVEMIYLCSIYCISGQFEQSWMPTWKHSHEIWITCIWHCWECVMTKGNLINTPWEKKSSFPYTFIHRQSIIPTRQPIFTKMFSWCAFTAESSNLTTFQISNADHQFIVDHNFPRCINNLTNHCSVTMK